MKCNEVGELMHRKIDLDLSVQEEQMLDLHLAECSTCKLIFDKLSLLSSQLEQLPQVTPPFSIVDSILPKLMEMETGEKTRLNKNEEAVSIDLKTNKKLYKKGWFISTISIAATAAAVLFTVNLAPNSSSSDNATQVATSLESSVDQSVVTNSTDEQKRIQEIGIMKNNVVDQHGTPSINPEKSDNGEPTSHQVDQFKVTVTNESIIDNTGKNESQVTSNEPPEEMFIATTTPTVREGGFTTTYTEEAADTELSEPMTILGFGVEEPDEAINIYNSPDNKVYVALVEHTIEIHDFNTAELLKTLEVPIEGETSFVGWHESGVEFYIDVVDSNMQTHRLTYTIGM